MTDHTTPQTLDELASQTARTWSRLRIGIDFELPPLLLAAFARLLSTSAATLAVALEESDFGTRVQMDGTLSPASISALAVAIGQAPDQIPDEWCN